MNLISQSHSTSPAAELEAEHFIAVQTLDSWQDIWEMFYRNDWFRRKLRKASNYAARKGHLNNQCADDIEQQAMIEFAKALQRNSSLGFDHDRGSFAGFLSTVIRRCCQKSLRQFSVRHTYPLDEEYLHPFYDDQVQLEKVIDFREMAVSIPEPYRNTIKNICDGLSIAEIARRKHRSKRTVYRWVDRAIELLHDKYFDESD